MLRLRRLRGTWAEILGPLVTPFEAWGEIWERMPLSRVKCAMRGQSKMESGLVAELWELMDG